MSHADFALDPRLAADSCPVVRLPLCDVRLMNEVRYPWLILVPCRVGLVEIADLPAMEQATLWQEVNRVGAALQATVPCDKLNVGALGNIVRQLHVHVVARRQGDTAWPGPVWGHSPAQPYSAPDLAARCRALAAALNPNAA